MLSDGVIESHSLKLKEKTNNGIIEKMDQITGTMRLICKHAALMTKHTSATRSNIHRYRSFPW